MRITLATTLLDAEAHPPEALTALYRARWNIELRYAEIKTTMGADVLRCQSPAMIEKELYMNAIGYNLIRCVMQEAAQRHGVELERLSFKGRLDAIHAAAGKPRRQPCSTTRARRSARSPPLRTHSTRSATTAAIAPLPAFLIPNRGPHARQPLDPPPLAASLRALR